MTRNQLPIVFLVLLVLGAGCLSGPQSPASPEQPTSANTSVDGSAPPFPKKPASLSQDTVIEYATSYERATTYRKVHSPGAEVTLNCNAALDKAADNGYYVVAAWGGSVTNPDGEHGDLAPAGHAYFINTSETIRIEPTYLRNVRQQDIYTSENRSENLYRPAGLNAGGFEVLNFDGANHTVSVQVTYLTETNTPRIFSQSYSVGEHGGIVQPGVTARKGTHNVSIQLDNGATSAFGWSPSAEHVNRVAIVITPNGESRCDCHLNQRWCRGRY